MCELTVDTMKNDISGSGLQREITFISYVCSNTRRQQEIALVSSSATAEPLHGAWFHFIVLKSTPHQTEKKEVILCVINPQMCIIEPFQSTVKPSKIIFVLNFKPFSSYVTVSYCRLFSGCFEQSTLNRISLILIQNTHLHKHWKKCEKVCVSSFHVDAHITVVNDTK